MSHKVFENKAARNFPPLIKIELHTPQANIKVPTSENEL
jgi:hypothetical protein